MGRSGNNEWSSTRKIGNKDFILYSVARDWQLETQESAEAWVGETKGRAKERYQKVRVLTNRYGGKACYGWKPNGWKPNSSCL